MITLNENDKDLIRHTGYPKKLSLSSGDFYIKMIEESPLYELLGAYLADLMKINHANYEIVEVDDREYFLSEDLSKYGEFKTAAELNIVEKHSSLYDIWNELEKRFGHVEEEMLEIVKIYIYDILFKNFDRRPNNWGIIFTKDGKRKVTIFDNEYIFSCADFILMWADIDAVDNNGIFEDLRVFLKESGRDFIECFIKYYDIFSPEFIFNLAKKIKNENKIDYDLSLMFRDYKEYYKKIGDILEEYRGRKI